jgi:LysM repeat protein
MASATAAKASPTISTVTTAATTALATQAAALAPIPTATPGLPATYTIHEGENLYCLARRFNIDPIALLDFNQKTSDYKASTGDVLKIPVTDKKWTVGPQALQPHTPNMSYLVKSGDTIYTVGCYFGDVDPNAIVLANNLQPPDYTLTTGKSIRIP